jgi:hypothetical protein
MFGFCVGSVSCRFLCCVARVLSLCHCLLMLLTVIPLLVPGIVIVLVVLYVRVHVRVCFLL